MPWATWAKRKIQKLLEQLEKVSLTALAYRALSRVAVEENKKLKQENQRLQMVAAEWKQAHDDLEVACHNYEARLKECEALLERWREWEKEIQNLFK